MHPQNESSFFQLPAELRETIQRFTLLPRDRDEPKLLEEARFTEVFIRTRERPVPTIMRTCKKMYKEMSPFAFTEILVHMTPEPHGTSHRLLNHGNLRWERLRQISVVFSGENSPNSMYFSGCGFLPNLLSHCPEVNRLDLEFYDCDLQMLEEAMSAAEERRQNGNEEWKQDFPDLDIHAKPDWLKGIVRHPGIRMVSFGGKVPEVWLKNLRRESKGQIQVFSNGVRFKEEQQQDSYTRDKYSHGDLDRYALVDPLEAKSDEPALSQARGAAGREDIQFQIVFEPASRFD